jgi:ubiquitin-protein ligase
MSISDRIGLKRLTNEITKLTTEKTIKELEDSGIFIILNEDNIREVHFVIFGAENTPYQYCPLFFKLDIPNTYPHTPPHGTFITTNGKTRFNPNLYVNGKICLSILGTWQGPGWSSALGIQSVINSIQGLIMNETPLINEPSYENTTLDKKLAYNYYVEYYSISYALCEQLKNIENHSPFDTIKDKLKSYFLKYVDKLITRLDKLIETNQMKLVSCNYVNINETYDYIKLKQKVMELVDYLIK